MSKLIDKIKAHQTSNKFYNQPKLTTSLFSFDETCVKLDKQAMLYEYDCRISLGAFAKVENLDELNHHLKILRRQIAEEIYGEFKDDLFKLHRVISDGDRTEALRIANNIYETMFSD